MKFLIGLMVFCVLLGGSAMIGFGVWGVFERHYELGWLIFSGFCVLLCDWFFAVVTREKIIEQDAKEKAYAAQRR